MIATAILLKQLSQKTFTNLPVVDFVRRSSFQTVVGYRAIPGFNSGTVGLFGARPFDNKGFRAAIGGQIGTNSLTKDAQPRLTGLISRNWGDVGILLSGAYSRRQTREEGFDTYRWRLNNASGSNIARLSAADQAAVRSGTLRFPRGNRLSVWDSTQERIGLTAAVQWKPADTVTLTLDGLYGRTFKYDTADATRWHARNINIGANYQGSAFDNAKGALAFDVLPGGTLRIGGEWRRFANDGYGQGVDNVLLPQFRSGAVSTNIAAYARTYRDYPGQDWTVVDYDLALKSLGVNRAGYPGARQNVFTVEERTGAGFVQYDWDQQVGSLPFRDNAGFRHYRTDVTSSGVANVGQVTVKGDYDGVLPAMNLVIEPADGLIVRAAAARNINRPGLGALAVNGNVARDNGEVTVSIGNPNLRPYRSTDLDLSIERYFGKVGYVAAALFYKSLDGFITNHTINNVAFGTTGLLPGLSDATNVTAFSRPVNIGKTDIKGIELSGQSDFTFLPAPFDRFGTVLHLTLIDSKFDYATIIPGSTRTTLEGLSRVNANATLYYQDARFNARVSGNYRSPYVFSASPVFSALGKDQDVTGYEATLYVDLSARYSVTRTVQLTLDGINLTDQRERQYSDSTKRLHVSTHSGATVPGGVRVTF